MLKKIISLVLVLSMVMTINASALAEAPTKYLKEIKLGSKSELENAGYTVFDSNLNEGTEKDAVYLGYKKTDDPGEAITDIRALEEGKDYQLVDADKLNSDFFAEDAMADAILIMEIIEEFRRLYKDGNLSARYIYELLETYAYDEQTRLGDFIVNYATKANMSEVILNASDDMKYGLYSALFMGIHEDGADTWQKRMVNTEGEELDSSELITNARAILVSVKSFRIQMATALATEYGENEQMDVTLQSAKEVLESYEYDDGNLFEYFMDSELTSETLLPLVNILSQNEIEMIKFIGFANFNYIQDGEVDETMITEAHDNAEITEPIDFWYGSVAEQAGKIAVTSDAIRDLATNDDAQEKSKMSDATVILAEAAGASLLLTVILFAGSRIAQNSKSLVSFSRYVKAFQCPDFISVPTLAVQLAKVQSIAKSGGFYESAGGMSMVTLPDSVTKFATSAKGASMTTKELSMTRVTAASKALSGVAKATIVLTIVLCLVDVGFLIYDLTTVEDVEHAEKPGRALSLEKLANGEYGYINYDTVSFLNGNYGDTNNDEGEKWMLLLTTKDSRMGTPIKADSLKISSKNYMYGLTPVSILGQNTAADLNANAFIHNKTNCLFFERASADTLASIFSKPTLIGVIAGIVLLVAAGITVTIIVRKKRKANTISEA